MYWSCHVADNGLTSRWARYRKVLCRPLAEHQSDPSATFSRGVEYSLRSTPFVSGKSSRVGWSSLSRVRHASDHRPRYRATAESDADPRAGTLPALQGLLGDHPR